MKKRYKKPASPKSSQENRDSYPDKNNCPIFSFRYLTNNKTYSFEYFNDTQGARKVAHSLLIKLIELSSQKISDLLMLNKTQGFELIVHSSFNHTLLIEGVPLRNDVKLYIMRFNNQNSRIIFHKAPSAPNLFYIMAFDFDYSIYDHS